VRHPAALELLQRSRTDSVSRPARAALCHVNRHQFAISDEGDDFFRRDAISPRDLWRSEESLRNCRFKSRSIKSHSTAAKKMDSAQITYWRFDVQRCPLSAAAVH
jgi:hypothetical protein